jgi:hypothetical protein
MGAASVPGLIESSPVGVETFGGARRQWKVWLGSLLLALAIGCTAAPLAGKPCPCAIASGYTCCETLQTCVTDIKQCPPAPCLSAKNSSPIVTGNGLPPPILEPTDAGKTQLKFGAQPEQWVSYIFAGTPEPDPMVSASTDGNGIEVDVSFNDLVNTANAFAGAGLTFVGDHCVDGTALDGVKFDFDGDLGGRQLEVGVGSSEDVDAKYPHGTCTAGDMKCYGPTVPINPMTGRNTVWFTDLNNGTPAGTLDTSRIVNVQWQVHAAQSPTAHFTITNVTFFSGQPADGG